MVLFSNVHLLSFDTIVPFNGEKYNHHIYLSAYKLGILFGQDKDALVKLLQATGVSL